MYFASPTLSKWKNLARNTSNSIIVLLLLIVSSPLLSGLPGIFSDILSQTYQYIHTKAIIDNGRIIDSPLINHHHLLPNDTCAQPTTPHDVHKIHIIIIRGKNEDISWLFMDDKSLIYQGPTTIYQDTSSPPLPITTTRPPPGLSFVTLPLGTFRETAFMLDAIITAYNSSSSLWSHLAFFHANQRSWHSLLTNDWILRRWAAWSPSSLSLGYAGTHCRQANTADTRDLTTRQQLHPYRYRNEDRFKGKTTMTLSPTVPVAWKEFLGHWLGEMPDRIQGPCCAEFIVSRERVRSRPLEFYIEAKKWLTSTDTLTPLQLSYVFEYSWHYIFTGQPIVVQPQHQCLCELYGLDVLPSQFTVAPDIGVNVGLGLMVGGVVGIGVVSRVWRRQKRRRL